MIGAFDQKLAEIAIAGLCNAELGIAVPGLASAWSQAEIAANISASLEALFIAQGEYEGQCSQMSNAINLDQRLCLRISSPRKFFNRQVVLLDLHRHVSNLVEQRARAGASARPGGSTARHQAWQNRAWKKPGGETRKA